MKRKLCACILFSLILVFIAACGGEGGSVGDITINIGGQTGSGDVGVGVIPTPEAETAQSPADDSAATPTWVFILIAVVGLPLSVVGIWSVFVIVKTIRSRRQ